MNRREFLRLLGVSAAAAGLARTARSQPAPGPGARKPNIIFVMLDDAGIGDFGCYGSKAVRTPVMDRMAAEGMRFTQAYTGSPICGPCRCILMTGMHAGHATRRNNRAGDNPPSEGKDKGLVPLRAEDYTVASLLKSAGYVTGGFGKWGLGNPGTTGAAEKKGFDVFFGYYDQVHAHDYYTDHLVRNGENVPQPAKSYSHNAIAAEAMKFIRDNKDKPFFLYLPYTLPHGNYVIPSDEPYTNEPWPQQVKNYAAMITLADRDVGRMLDLLKELKLDNDTIVFYTSDNGPNPPFIKALNSNAGLRGAKGNLYEAGIRMPMVVRWPGQVPAGAVSDFAWTFADFLPTAAAVAGAQPPQGIDGVNILPTLLGKHQPPHTLYWEFPQPFQQAVRIGDFKGIRFGTADPLVLYDLAKDPKETTDVSAAHPDVVKKMEAFLAAARTDSPYWPAREHAGDGPAKGKKAKAGKKKQT